MQVNIINRSNEKIPQLFIEEWVSKLNENLKLSTAHKNLEGELVVVFVGLEEMTQLNRDFRGKDGGTDILSFEGEGIGELVLCGKILLAQAKEHGLSSRQELGYLLIHGLLHLLGYEHEGVSEAEAEEMYSLQQKLLTTYMG